MNYFKKIKYKKINKNINIKKIYMCVKHEIPTNVNFWGDSLNIYL